ncbi:carbohydrate-binding protein [Actinophytocola oryzae]|uniref:Carbohydrate binding protein with CBM6 domain n=1 Tax=Actinophytocola oryzae TaxID=502181 RepID=A0A4R7V0M0_9PSEU|nr:carbohydrate-binding protein [Actinophytocola oryzae]TDV40936.1 carbohydrate binding protein with CBM6 domain [Actinophytocola oryzae]
MLGRGTGCGFTFNTGEIHSGLDARQFYVVRATYTDRGATGSVPLTGETSLTLWPKHWQAEHFDQLSGPQVITAAGAEGGKRLGGIQTGEWVRHHAVSLQGVTGVPVTGAVATARPLYIVFTGAAGQAILDLDSYTFTGPGVNPTG